MYLFRYKSVKFEIFYKKNPVNPYSNLYLSLSTHCVAGKASHIKVNGKGRKPFPTKYIFPCLSCTRLAAFRLLRPAAVSVS